MCGDREVSGYFSVKGVENIWGNMRKDQKYRIVFVLSKMKYPNFYRFGVWTNAVLIIFVSYIILEKCFIFIIVVSGFRKKVFIFMLQIA